MRNPAEDGRALDIRLFGETVSVHCGGDAPRKPRSRRGLWLLGLLALRANQDVSRSWLAGILWPDSDQARETLRRTLTDLRTTLGACHTALVATSQTVRLSIPESHVDALAFDSLLRSDSLAAIEEAIALYRGPLLAECREPWVEPERARRATAYVEALERAASAHLARGNPSSAVAHLRQAVRAEPYRESLYRALMRALVAAGDTAAAILLYRDLRLLLQREMRSAPSAETVALYRQIRAPEPAAPAGELPATTTPNAPAERANLPRPLTGLLGRESELRQVIDHLTRSRLVTLTGAGGFGKTRLAIEAARQVQDQFSEGICFVDLAPISEPGLTARAVAGALAIREEAGQETIKTLITHLGERHLLLVLDNGEHLIDACASLVRSLVTACPHLHVLATSRQPLRLTGEVVQLLEPLAMPERHATLTGTPEATLLLERSAAVQLFVERARAVRPGFTLSAETAPSVVEICRRLDGIPLALELAAARVASLAVTQIASSLKDRFRLLTGGDRTAPRRQRSLRSLVDWSYDLLEESEQAAFAHLSVFAGGWTTEAATAVLSDTDSPDPAWETLDLLDALAERSLIVVQVSEVGTTRYRMLETLRQYATEKLAERGDRAVAQARYVRWCCRFAETANQDPGGPRETELLPQVRVEHDNLLHALHASGPGEERMRLAVAMYRYWYVQGHYTEGRSWLERALEETPDAPVALRCKALKGAGDLCWAQGDMDRARHHHLQNLDLQRDANDLRGVSFTLDSLGLVAHHQGDYGAAFCYYRQSIDILRQIGEAKQAGLILFNLSMLLQSRGCEEESGRVLEEAECLFRELGDRRGLARTLHVLGLLASRQGDYPLARRRLQDTNGEAIGRCNLGDIALHQGDTDFAEQCFRAGLAVFRRMGSKRSMASAIGSLGEVAIARGAYAEAGTHLRECLQLEIAVGNRLGISDAVRRLAHLEQVAGRSERAARLLAAAESESERLGIPPPPEWRHVFDRFTAAVRESLGEAAFSAHWAAGSAMDLETAVAYGGWT